MTRTPALALAVLAALSLAACGGGQESSSAPGGAGAGTGAETVAASGAPAAQTAAVAGNPRLQFVPSTVTARPGTLALTLQIEGGVPHDLAFTDDAVGADIPVTSEGSATGTYRFPRAGTYDFVCTLHPGMEGRVVVS